MLHRSTQFCIMLYNALYLYLCKIFRRLYSVQAILTSLAPTKPTRRRKQFTLKCQSLKNWHSEDWSDAFFPIIYNYVGLWVNINVSEKLMIPSWLWRIYVFVEETDSVKKWIIHMVKLHVMWLIRIRERETVTIFSWDNRNL